MDVKTDSHQKMLRGIRNSNIELFRIISMLVISNHCMLLTLCDKRDRYHNRTGSSKGITFC